MKKLLTGLVLTAAVCGAEVLTVSDDAVIRSDKGKYNYGDYQVLTASFTSSKITKSYLRFTLPEGKKVDAIESVEITYCGDKKSRSSQVYILKTETPWSQDDITWNNAPANAQDDKMLISEKVIQIGVFPKAAVENSRPVAGSLKLAFVNDGKADLLKALNRAGTVTLILVQPGKDAAGYASLENEAGHAPARMTLTFK